MKNQQGGFTLVEIAIVLVIIGLLLGGVLKGQELINSAKVKNFATDFRNIPLFIYGYQDKFRALPGDDKNAQTNLGATAVLGANGTLSNGVIEGNWNTNTVTDETAVFWQHVRLANLAPGSTAFNGAANTSGLLPTNADGGKIGLQGGASPPITTMNKTSYVICSEGILGKFVKQLDITLDDGKTDSGSLQAAKMADLSAVGSTHAAETTANIVDGSSYTVCLGF